MVARLALVGCLFACGSQAAPVADPSWREAAARSQRQVRPPEPEPVRDAVLEGEVVDGETREKIAGAVILASPQTGRSETAISDDAGRYRIEVPAGQYHVEVYYADEIVELGDVPVASYETARRVVELPHAAVEAAKALEVPRCAEISGREAFERADVEALAVAVLTRFVTDPSTMPDGAVAERGTIYVAIERHDLLPVDPDDRPSLLPGAVFDLGGRKFLSLSRAELQTLADKRGIPFRYILIAVDVGDGCAEGWSGTSVMSPARAENGANCAALDIFKKRRGVWQYDARVGTYCSSF